MFADHWWLCCIFKDQSWKGFYKFHLMLSLPNPMSNRAFELPTWLWLLLSLALWTLNDSNWQCNENKSSYLRHFIMHLQFNLEFHSIQRCGTTANLLSLHIIWSFISNSSWKWNIYTKNSYFVAFQPIWLATQSSSQSETDQDSHWNGNFFQNNMRW